MYLGFETYPQTHDRLADEMPEEELRRSLAGMRQSIQAAAQASPTHAEFIARYCASPAQ